MNTRLIGNKVIFLSLSMLFLSGTLFYTNKWAFLQPILLALPLLIIIVISIFKNIKIQVDYPAIVVFYIFTFLSIVSALLLQRLSATITLCPASNKATQVCEPIYPAPPVTSSFLILIP